MPWRWGNKRASKKCQGKNARVGRSTGSRKYTSSKEWSCVHISVDPLHFFQMFVKPITFLVTERFNAKIILSGPLLPSLFGTLFSSFDRRILFLPHWLVVRGLSGRPRVSATAHHGIQRPGTPQGQNGQQVIEFGGEKQTAVLYHQRSTRMLPPTATPLT